MSKQSIYQVPSQCSEEMKFLSDRVSDMLLEGGDKNYTGNDPERLNGAGSRDLLLCNMIMRHDLAEVLTEAKALLNEGGVFIYVFLGSNSLSNPEMFPVKNFVDLSATRLPHMKDVGALALSLGFRDVICDSDVFKIRYNNIGDLSVDLGFLNLAHCLCDEVDVWGNVEPFDAEFEVIQVRGVKPVS